MTNLICPYCYVAHTVPDKWDELEEGKLAKKRCDHCKKDFVWSYANFPEFETEEMEYCDEDNINTDYVE